MKFGESPRKIWHSSADLQSRFNRLNIRLNRLLILDHVWSKLVGLRSKYWVLKAVQNGTLHVQVKVPVARTELIAKKESLIRELNKHFDNPWIKKIEIE